MRKGIKLKDGITAPAKIQVRKRLKNKTWLEIELHEGKYREVRRIFDALGYSVDKLKRIRFGPIRLGSLPVGRFQSLSREEVEALQRTVRLPKDKDI